MPEQRLSSVRVEDVTVNEGGRAIIPWGRGLFKIEEATAFDFHWRSQAQATTCSRRKNEDNRPRRASCRAPNFRELSSKVWGRRRWARPGTGPWPSETTCQTG